MPKHSPSMDFGPSTRQFDSAYPQDALPPGTRLGGYQIIEMLGRGGFGIVYLALDASLQRQVAIKEYLPAETAMRCDDNQVWVRPGADTMAYAAGKTAFLNEAKLLARFDHPALARVHTFWEENRTAYMVMPYYEGHTLAVVLAGMQQPPDEAWLRALLTPLLSALQVLHMAQCLHLDISPDNIIVQRDGRPVLLDFGVASRLATDKTMPLTALLNPAYAPIEQYSESATLPQGPWSDLYALAGVLHFAIAGRPPARATVRAVDDPQRPLSETVAALRERHPGLQYSESFLAAIDKALAVRPRDRPRNVLEFEQLLDRSAGEAAARGATTPLRFATPPAATPATAAPGPAPAAIPPQPAPAPAFTASQAPLPPAAPTAAEMPGGRSEPLFHAPPPREDWFTADPQPTPPRPPAKRARSRAPLWIATVCLLGLAGVGGWAWLKRQPSQARISVTDLPQSVVAAVPKPGVVTGPTIAAPTPASTPATTPATTPAAAPAPAAVPIVAEPAASTVAVAPPPVTAPAASAAAAPLRSAATTAAAPPTDTTTPASPKAAPAAAQRTTPVPARKARAAVAATAPQPAPAEPGNPRAICGTRTNFALYYCMETQCKRPKFAYHPQCLEFKRDDGS